MLAKGISLDLHPQAFRTACAQSLVSHAAIT